MTTTQRVPHPDMKVLTEAQKVAYGGTTIAEQRAAWTAYTSRLAPPRPAGMIVRDAFIPTQDCEVPVRIYRPADSPEALPCIIYMHGGGFMKGDLDSSDPIAWGFTQETGAVTISVDYRLTPEFPYPAAFNDCYGVLTYVAGNAREFGINPMRIGLAGDSAGGHLAASLCLAARDRKGPRISAQAIIYTVIGTDMTAASYVENAEGYGLTTAACHNYMKLLLPDPAMASDPYARPAVATDFSGLPPAYVVSAELDPVRDDGRIYAAKLAMAGIDVTYREARSMIHGFMRARFTGPAARAEYERICAFLAQHLRSATQRVTS
ncbi:MAG: alpha/beta hydrolase [Acetobacteraceae bacterium]